MSRPSCFPFASRQAQLYIGIALALLLVATRGNHVGSIHALPSASWAVFFLAGVMLRPRWMFAVFMALAVTVDMASVGLEQIGSTCLSPAYWMLVPAYAVLWGAGRLYARIHVEHPATLLRLAPLLALASLLAYQFSGGGYYLFSGSYPEPTLAGYVERVLRYAPQRLYNLSVYVLGATVLYASWQLAATGSAAGRNANT